MKQVEMRTKICPFLNGDDADVPFILCQGDECMAFNSRPTYEYLNKKGEIQAHMGDLQMFDKDDKTPEVMKLLQEGWERTYPQYTMTSLRRNTEPECWCDAMPANMECGFEAP